MTDDAVVMLLERGMLGSDLDKAIARLRGGAFLDEVHQKGVEKVRESFDMDLLVSLTAR